MEDRNPEHTGPIAWMAKNPVAANIAMAILLLGGFLSALTIKQEVFPEFSLDIISVTIPYPGASPKEIEEGILLALEEGVRGIDNVKRVTTTATEGAGSALVEIVLNSDVDKVLSDIKSAVDQIRSFPEGAEKPTSRILQARSEVIALVVHGQVDEDVLRHYAEKARDDLLDFSEITLVNLAGAKEKEISIEVSQSALSAHDLTFAKIAQQVRLASIEIPAGDLKTFDEELALRTSDKLKTIQDFEDLIIKSDFSGARVRLGEIAHVFDTYEEASVLTQFNGEPAIMVRIFRMGDQTPLEIAAIVKDYKIKLDKELPPNMSTAIWNDMAELYDGRVNLVLRNAFMGLILVFFVIGLFLEARLAFWVTMGIPASFLGAFLLVPSLGVSINMISLFAFIVTLGLVVDDAIVVGENIYEFRSKEKDPLTASIKGTKQIATPIIFAILTTNVAFMPMFFVPGVFGKFFRVIPAIVVSVLIISLIESLFILPAHLAHIRERPAPTGIKGWLHARQQAFSKWFMSMVETHYRPLVVKAVRFRYLTAASGLAIFIFVLGLFAGGRLVFSFMPNIESDIISVTARYPVGTPVETTYKLQSYMVEKANEALAEIGKLENSRGIYTQIGMAVPPPGPPMPGSGITGSHALDLMMFLESTEKRDFSSDDFVDLWRKKVGDVPGIRSLAFSATMGPSAGSSVDIKLSHKDEETLKSAAIALSGELRNFPQLTAIQDGVSEGKKQLEFKVKEAGRRLGISSQMLGRYVRGAFYGEEALRQQKGRDEVKVMVRLPMKERRSLYAVENLKIRTPMGHDVPLSQIAEVNMSTSFSKIQRQDGRRILHITADLALGTPSSARVLSSLEADVLPKLMKEYPGLKAGFSGEQQEQAESMGSLGLGYLSALLLIYALLAIPFKSYIQPLVVMSAIPFGFVGAVFGHMILGYDLSFVSMLGLVALSGVVVNDSLVLIHAANENHSNGSSMETAVVNAGVRRFRPITLTSLTTFFGLLPMIFETSLQARFLIPMAISLGFGVMFATGITLLLVPAFYVIVEDMKQWSSTLFEKKEA